VNRSSEQWLNNIVMVRELHPVLTEGVKADIPRKPCSLADEVTGFFDQLRGPLLRYLLSFGLPLQDGEEVIQEVFLSLFQHLQRGGSRTNLRGWIFRVAHNLGLKRCNVNRVRTKLFQQSWEQSADAHLDPAPNPEERWASRRRQQRLLAVIQAFPEQDRRCLYLRAEGLRYREITGVLGMSLGAVALSLERSLARLSRADGL
jgi:RNA polymerase sigma-70 factor, ECF subfamily